MNYGNAKALRRSHLCAALMAAIALPGAGQALAQDADGQNQPTAQEEAKTLDKVTVTGSRIARSQVEGPSPVTVISAQQIEAEGFVSVNDGSRL